MFVLFAYFESITSHCEFFRIFVTTQAYGNLYEKYRDFFIIAD